MIFVVYINIGHTFNIINVIRSILIVFISSANKAENLFIRNININWLWCN